MHQVRYEQTAQRTLARAELPTVGSNMENKGNIRHVVILYFFLRGGKEIDGKTVSRVYASVHWSFSYMNFLCRQLNLSPIVKNC